MKSAIIVVDEKSTFGNRWKKNTKNNNTMIPVLYLLLAALCIASPIAQATATSAKSKNDVCSGHRVTVPFSSRTLLPLNHRHGPCSPFPSSERRVPSMSDSIWRGSSAVAKRPTAPTSLETLEYVVTVGLGTPAVNQNLYVDTGSDVSWVQCRRCPVPAACHPQKDPLFDPAKSSTYSTIPCGSAACRSLDDYGCSGRLCQYAVAYGDGSNTTGTYSADKLTLSPSGYAVDGFRFGCSHTAQGFGDDLADGLIGLGGGKPSIVSQMAEKAFSYCLPPSASYSGFLSLGAPPRWSGFAVTPMYLVDTHYLVFLQGIVVAGRRLRVPTSAFAAGAVMDSGTLVTQLPPAAYRALRAAFRKEMRSYPLAPPPSDIFDTCYSVLNESSSGGDVMIKVPSVALVFDRGATVELDRSGVIQDGCLAFTSNDDDASVGIIGNVQQRTFEVLYDIGGGAVGFRPGAC
ncbi:hypothetical protein EJB05_46608 [Eragrostis curvula]|uniref:Peptidase A1 domain-containing protein n=1 Tax=Eragrostis curvula TaxID=38414 RepID=A0A5J9TQJ1_9POAL|nr:hypothetical protein EJB05_46608 [Eragrostis curvula]